MVALNQEEDKILMPRGDNSCQDDSIQNNFTKIVLTFPPLHVFTIHFPTTCSSWSKLPHLSHVRPCTSGPGFTLCWLTRDSFLPCLVWVVLFSSARWYLIRNHTLCFYRMKNYNGEACHCCRIHTANGVRLGFQPQGVCKGQRDNTALRGRVPLCMTSFPLEEPVHFTSLTWSSAKVTALFHGKRKIERAIIFQSNALWESLDFTTWTLSPASPSTK